ncbi:tricarboxylate transport protein TctC [Vibrio variabilis]|uniref:Tricarboxylate transport protein TctC n=1 Tax=Vibrio variabilis TaxID=990271 RepID=A0ABQ0JQD8_9VIBR|nr:tricarboxylate transport protein TctC [Vibrio variabilis]
MLNMTSLNTIKGMTGRRFLQTLLIAAFGISAIPSNTHAKDVSFSGERVELFMPYKEGGGTDTWGRFYAPYLSEALPGQPVVVVKKYPRRRLYEGCKPICSPWQSQWFEHLCKLSINSVPVPT